MVVSERRKKRAKTISDSGKGKASKYTRIEVKF
jgi:hypothetical protein